MGRLKILDGRKYLILTICLGNGMYYGIPLVYQGHARFLEISRAGAETKNQMQDPDVDANLKFRASGFYNLG